MMLSKIFIKFFTILFKLFIAAVLLNFTWVGQYEFDKKIDRTGNLESESITVYLWQRFPYIDRIKIYDGEIIEDLCADSCIALSASLLSTKKPIFFKINQPKDHNIIYKLTIDVLLLGLFSSLLLLIIIFWPFATLRWLKLRFSGLFNRSN